MAVVLIDDLQCVHDAHKVLLVVSSGGLCIVDSLEQHFVSLSKQYPSWGPQIPQWLLGTNCKEMLSIQVLGLCMAQANINVLGAAAT